MSDQPVKSSPKSTTPLRIIALFVSFTEAVTGLVLASATGGVQVALTSFVIVFPLLVAAGFFLVLWYRPYVFYPPTEFGDATDVMKYVGAMRPHSNVTDALQLQPTIAASVAVATAAIVEPAPSVATPDTTEEENWWQVYQAKDYDRAVTLILRQAEVGKTEPEFARAFAGKILLDKSKAEGVASFETTFRDIPTAAMPYWMLAYAYMSWEQFDQALDVLDRGIAAGADFIDLGEVRARCLSKMGRLDEAITSLKAVSERAPTRASPYVTGASLFEEDKDLAHAEEWYRRALTVDPQDASALAAMGAITAAAGRHPEAVVFYKRLITIRPDNPTYHTLLGNVYLELDLNSKALAAYEKADELAKHEQAWILANIGNILKNRGFHAKAADYLRRAVTLEPGYVYAQERLAGALRLATEEDEKENELIEALKPKQEQVTAGPSLLIRSQ